MFDYAIKPTSCWNLTFVDCFVLHFVVQLGNWIRINSSTWSFIIVARCNVCVCDYSVCIWDDTICKKILQYNN